jgi:hypothetical protein
MRNIITRSPWACLWARSLALVIAGAGTTTLASPGSPGELPESRKEAIRPVEVITVLITQTDLAGTYIYHMDLWFAGESVRLSGFLFVR